MKAIYQEEELIHKEFKDGDDQNDDSEKYPSDKSEHSEEDRDELSKSWKEMKKK